MIQRRGAMVALLLGGLPAMGYAQEGVSISESSSVTLPDSPGWTAFGGGAYQAAQQQGTASVAGVVMDISEAAVAGATVTLTEEGHPDRIVKSGELGAFTFSELPPGSYHVTISAPGLETFVSDDVSLHAGEHKDLPQIALPLERANSTVQVTVTQDQLAEEQVKQAVQQRVLGVLPNFYSSYIWNAAPLKAKHKFQLAFLSVTDPAVFVTTGITAGIEQANNTFRQYGQGAEGYGKRYAAAYGDVLVGRIIGSAILPSLLHQDPRYFYRGSGSTGSRVWYAMTRAVVTRQDNGKTRPNYSHILGSVAAGAVSNAYRPGKDRGVELIYRNLLIGTAANATVNLVREFLLRKIVTHVPDYAQGKRELTPAQPKGKPTP